MLDVDSRMSVGQPAHMAHFISADYSRGCRSGCREHPGRYGARPLAPPRCFGPSWLATDLRTISVMPPVAPATLSTSPPDLRQSRSRLAAPVK